MERIQLGHRQIDLEERLVRDGEDSQPLSEMEARLLAYLAENPGRPVDQHELLREVWGYGDRVVSRTVRSTVNRLRAKIEDDPREPAFLRTVRGFGYELRVTPLHHGAQTNLPPSTTPFIGREGVLAS